MDGVAALVDWAELDHLLAGISAWAKGEWGWPSLRLFRALLLATWHDLPSFSVDMLRFPAIARTRHYTSGHARREEAHA